MEVDEGSGSTEVCVMVHKPNTTVPIPDVVVNVYPMYLGEASKEGCMILAGSM